MIDPELTRKSSEAQLHSCSATTSAQGPLKTALFFSLVDQVGALQSVLDRLRSLNVNLSRIESRPSKGSDWTYDFFVEFDAKNAEEINQVVDAVKKVAQDAKVISASDWSKSDIPWFPRKISDLDVFCDRVLGYGDELDADHPGFKDEDYRKRRTEIAQIARTYRYGSPIPKIDYTPEEVQTWTAVLTNLTRLFPSHACKEHQYVFPLLVENCGYKPGNVPQLEDISRFLKDCTGFTVRPVMGLLTSRDFLNSLAFRVFHSTQYIRHHSVPFYTPEPDLCHELLGHVPLFADPDFADFSQEIGLASLGASDEDIEKLATIYWFSVEFGICKQGNEIRAYGAGLLSSFGELEYCLSDKPERLPFEPAKVAVTKYPITSYQPTYFVAESFRDAKEKVRDYAASLPRPFSVRYNPFTQTVEVLDKKEKILKLATSIRSDVSVLVDALSKLSA